MITTGRAAYQIEERVAEYVGLSSDSKTDNDVIIQPHNGDIFREIDTGNIFRYNEETVSWVQQPAQGGGGGSQTTGVTSFNGRTGAVTPAQGDYTAALVGAVDKAGDTMTGDLDMSGHTVTGISDALEATDALPKGQADDIYVNVTGDTMEGNLDMGNNKITMGATPTEITDVTNKGYVDGVVKVVSDEVDGILAGTTPVALPIATETHLGGIKVGAGLSIDDEGVLSSNESAVLNSLPEQMMVDIVNVQRTETTNTAEIQIADKQPDGTYTTADHHGVITLIPAGMGPDGVNGAGLMTASDKAKLDGLPVPTAEDEGKLLVVQNGQYVLVTISSILGGA